LALAVVGGDGYGEGFFGLGSNAEVGVGLCEDDSSILCDDVGGGDGQAPAWLPVDEGDVDEDGAVVGLVVLGDGVDEAEFFREGAAGVVQHRKRQPVLAGHEVALPLDLRADGDHERFALAEGAVEVAPRFELGDAIGAPAAAEEFDDEGAECEQIGGANQAAGGVFEGELGSDGADGEDSLLDAGGEQLGDGALTHGKAIGLHQVAGVGGDFVELVLQGGGGHGYMNFLFLNALMSSAERSNHSPCWRFSLNRLCQYFSIPGASSIAAIVCISVIPSDVCL
jgi:hypothetical protein